MSKSEALDGAVRTLLHISLLLVLVLAIIAAGCTTQTTSRSTSQPIVITATPTTPPPTPEALWDETAYVEDGYEQSYSFDVTDPPVILKVSLSTDGSPVDLLVMNEVNYNTFSQGFTSGSKSSFKAIGSNYFIIKTTETYTLTKKGTYYVVIENADYLTKGANTGKGVRYSIKITAE